ncbi:phytanoyl-CoA dioxygenase family protein [Sphingomonas sp. HITSZ_GF]|uniref:phytanoyl-CoA dioxygenase family protein n=1 Tax=Sphingomonas sp. HITSZ_GF TaxID=3037247 RepID=UPI00240E08B5|nr:phytanoyl-CoA dioxygenase family protein [Sphingomonas sp. HITSZ_GF]MDG2534831.1 phytanoyl-CoA dioxygenase family protein [Sphingomonas sp. HITSZ_GF]
MADAEPALLPPIRGLRTYWERRLAHRSSPPGDWIADKLLLDALGLGLEQVLEFLAAEAPGFEGFCRWIVATAGLPDALTIARYHAALDSAPPPPETAAHLAMIDAMPDALDAGDIAHWGAQGYVILRSAITPEEVAAAATLLWQTVGADPADPSSWYGPRTNGLMVQRFQHAALEPVRRSTRVHKAFAQLWGTSDLWVHIDRMSFNAPVHAHHAFAAPRLHWDVSLVQPIPFGTQAILYLADTDADQGALELVPGFHHGLAEWLETQGDADPRRVDLSDRAVHVPGRAGDLIIWRQDLPHGASPNTAALPRLAQYVNFYAAKMAMQPVWR